jgi:hypothetical protein
VKKIDPFESHPAIAPTSSYGEFSFGAYGLERAVGEIKRLQLEVAALRNIIRKHFDTSLPDFEERLNNRVRLEIEKIKNELQG